MSRPARPYVLKCGEHLLGEMSLDYGENWHNEGTLVPGPDLPRYEELFDEYRRLDREYEAASTQYHQDAITDEAMEAASEARDAVADRIDQLPLCLVEAETGRISPIHDFHPVDDSGKVYWRFTHDGTTPPRESLRDWAVFALIMAALPFTFVYMFGRWVAKKCRLTFIWPLKSSGRTDSEP